MSDMVSGTLDGRGESVFLEHVFAVLGEDRHEGGRVPRLDVFLSNEPVPDELRRATEDWVFWASEQSREGSLRGIILYIDAETGEWNNGQYLSTNGLSFYSESGTSPELRSLVFTPEEAADGILGGTVSMTKPWEGISGSGGDWSVEARFRCAVTVPESITDSLEGDEARQCEPYKAVEAYLQACLTRDLAAIRRTMASSMLASLDEMAAQDEDAALTMLEQMAEATFRMPAVRVVVRGTSADIEFSDPGEEYTAETIGALREDGVWKMGH
jgi:hypothetical protein